MEFRFNVEEKLSCDIQGFAVIDSSSLYDIKHSIILILQDIIDMLGFFSCKVLIE